VRVPAAVQGMGGLGKGSVIDTNVLIIGAPAREVVVSVAARSSGDGGDW